MSDAVEITDVTVQNFGSDICVSGHMKQKKGGISGVYRNCRRDGNHSEN